MENDARQQSYTSVRSDIVHLVPPSARRILDVGCSNGALGHYLKSVANERLVCGIEFDPGFADAAAQCLDQVIHADVNLLDWQSALQGQIFDCIIFADVLEHLLHPRQVLACAMQHLAPGGCVIISLPNVRHVSAFWSIFIQGRFPTRDRGLFDRTHLRWFTFADAQAMMRDLGLDTRDEVFSLRWRDQGGGLLNRALNRMPRQLQRLAPIRELLTYQMSFRAQARQ
ncbi:class I SAM-dependent methyltransferase [Comamonadaceae bacterium G21597-S1]|nr:class I SAM-dependent methyltransferase [Comamonadaceae bacterium G21597-S1]